MTDLLPVRDGFRAIIDGWEQDITDDIEFRVRQAALWLRDNEPVLVSEKAALAQIIDRAVEMETKWIVRRYLRAAGVLPDD